MGNLYVIARCKIHEGRFDAFRQAAAGCLDSVREKDTGTFLYNWYLTDDRSKGVVLEHYRDSEAVLEHIGNLGERFGALLETCDLTIEVFGDPSPELQEAAAGLSPKVYTQFQGTGTG